MDSSKNAVQFLNSTSKNSERSLETLFIKDILPDSDKPKKQTDDDDMNRGIKQAESFQEQWLKDNPSQLKPENNQNKKKAASPEATEFLLQEAKAVSVVGTEAQIAADTLGREDKTTHLEEQRTKADSYQLKDEEKQQIEVLASPNPQDLAKTFECTRASSENPRSVAIAEAEPLVAYEAIATETEVVSVEEQLTKGNSLHGISEDQSKEESISSSVAVGDLLVDTIKDPSPEAKVVHVGEIKCQTATDAVWELEGTVKALELHGSERGKPNIAERKEQKQEPAEEMDAATIQSEPQESHEPILEEDISKMELPLVANQSYQNNNNEAVCAGELACLSQQTVKETDAELGDLEVSTYSQQFVSQGITSVCGVLGEDPTASGTVMEQENNKPTEGTEEKDLPDYKYVEGSDLLSAISKGGGLQELLLPTSASTVALDEQSEDVKATEKVKERIEDLSNICPEGQNMEYGNNQSTGQSSECGPCVESSEQAMLLTSLERKNTLLEDKNIEAIAEAIAEYSITENATELPSETAKIMEVDHFFSKKPPNGRDLETNAAVVEYSSKQMDVGMQPGMDTGNETEIAGSAFAMTLESEDIPVKAIALVDLSKEDKTEMQEVLDSGVITEAILGSGMEPAMNPGNKTEIVGSAFATALENEDTPAKSITLVDFSKEGKTEMQDVLDSGVITEAPLGSGMEPGMDPGNETEISMSAFSMALENEDTPAKLNTLVDLSKEDKTEMQEVLDSGVITEPLGSGILFEGYAGEEFLSAELDKGMADTGFISEMESQPYATLKDIALMICSDRNEGGGTAILSNEVSEPETCIQVNSLSFPVLACNSCELMDQYNLIEDGFAANESDASVGVVELARQSSSALPEEFRKEIGKQLENSGSALQTLEIAQSEYQLESRPEGMEGLKNLEVPSRAITGFTMLTEDDSEHMPNLEEPHFSSHIQEMTQPIQCALESQDFEVIGNTDDVWSSETSFLSEVSGVVSQGQITVMIPEDEEAGIGADLTRVETGLVTQFVETGPVLQGIDGDKIDQYLAESVQELLEGPGNIEDIKNIDQELSQGEVVESEKLVCAPAENVQEIQEVDNTVKAALDTDIPLEAVQALKDSILESSRIEQGSVNILPTIKRLGSEGKTEADLFPKGDESGEQSGEEGSVLLKADTGIAEPEGFILDANEPEIFIEETKLSLQEKADSTESISVTHVLEVENQVFPDNIDQVLEKLASEFERQATAEIHDKVAAATESVLQEPTELMREH